MLKSMTAYGRGEVNKASGRFIVEIQSVNRKHLEIQVSLPRELNQLEIEIKKWLSPYVARGQVSVKVTATYESAIPLVVKPNLLFARQLKNGWDQIALELGMKDSSFNLSLLKGTEGLFSYEVHVDEDHRIILKEAFDFALNGFLQMKKLEGLALQEDILGRLAKMEEKIQLVTAKSPDAVGRYRDKLMSRLEELLPGKIENEERILREVALFAEKIDIAEEITRFNYHLQHFAELINGEEPSGKKIEFLIQELNREANTIGSKSSEIEISRAVIEIKSELERIREQIQNVE